VKIAASPYAMKPEKAPSASIFAASADFACLVAFSLLSQFKIFRQPSA
jgi:hypothetical protein